MVVKTPRNNEQPFPSLGALQAYVTDRLDPKSVRVTKNGSLVMRDTKIGAPRPGRHNRKDA